MADYTFPTNLRIMQRDILREWVKYGGRFPDQVIEGFQVIAGLNRQFTLTAGKAVVDGVYLRRDDATLGTASASATTHVYLTLDETQNNVVSTTMNTTGTPPASPYLKIAEIVSDASNITEVRNLRGRVSKVFSAVDTLGYRKTANIISEGYVRPHLYGFTTTGYAQGPGYAGLVGNRATAVQPGILVFGGVLTSAISHRTLVRGTKLTYKGRYTAHSTSTLNASFDPFGIGIAFQTDPDVIDGAFGHTTQTTRDDIGTVAVVVDSSKNIKSYNNAAASGGAYTDSGHDIGSFTTGFAWELTIEAPSTGDSADDLRVTVKIEDSTGTMQTILNAAVPVATSATLDATPVGLLNQNGLWHDMTFTVEHAA